MGDSTRADTGATLFDLIISFAFEIQGSQDLIYEPVRHRLALDPRQCQQIRTEDLARGLVLKLLVPRDLLSGDTSSDADTNRTQQCLTMRRGINGLPLFWNLSFHVRRSRNVLAVLPVSSPDCGRRRAHCCEYKKTTTEKITHVVRRQRQ